MEQNSVKMYQFLVKKAFDDKGPKNQPSFST